MMLGYKPRTLKSGRTVLVWKVMSCTCRRCKKVLTTRWPDTWQTHDWWCVIIGKKVKLYCNKCKKHAPKVKEVRSAVHRKARKDQEGGVHAGHRRRRKRR